MCSTFKSNKPWVVASSPSSSNRYGDTASLHCTTTTSPSRNHWSNQTMAPPHTIIGDRETSCKPCETLPLLPTHTSKIVSPRRSSTFIAREPPRQLWKQIAHHISPDPRVTPSNDLLLHIQHDSQSLHLYESDYIFTAYNTTLTIILPSNF